MLGGKVCRKEGREGATTVPRVGWVWAVGEWHVGGVFNHGSM